MAKQVAKVPHRDQMARVSFLYQAAASLGATPSASALSAAYAKSMETVAKKNVLRISPHMKRNICKSCRQVQVPGLSCSVRLVNESKSEAPHNDRLSITCYCGRSKTFPVGKNPEYTPFIDRATGED